MPSMKALQHTRPSVRQDPKTLDPTLPMMPLDRRTGRLIEKLKLRNSEPLTDIILPFQLFHFINPVNIFPTVCIHVLSS